MSSSALSSSVAIAKTIPVPSVPSVPSLATSATIHYADLQRVTTVVPREALFPCRWHPRESWGVVDEDLAESLSVKGQMTPLLVTPMSEDDARYTPGALLIIKGHRRYACNYDEYLVTILRDSAGYPLSDAECSFQYLVNTQGTTPLSFAELVVALAQWHVSITNEHDGRPDLTSRQWATILGISHTTVQKALRIMQQPEPIQQAVAGKLIQTDVVLRLMDEVPDEGVRVQLVQDAIAENMAREQSGAARLTVKQILGRAQHKMLTSPVGKSGVQIDPRLVALAGAIMQAVALYEELEAEGVTLPLAIADAMDHLRSARVEKEVTHLSGGALYVAV